MDSYRFAIVVAPQEHTQIFKFAQIFNFFESVVLIPPALLFAKIRFRNICPRKLETVLPSGPIPLWGPASQQPLQPGTSSLPHRRVALIFFRATAEEMRGVWVGVCGEVFVSGVFLCPLGSRKSSVRVSEKHKSTTPPKFF